MSVSLFAPWVIRELLSQPSTEVEKLTDNNDTETGSMGTYLQKNIYRK
jgi:hypothetical protein